VAVDNRKGRFTEFATNGELLNTFPHDQMSGSAFRLMGLDSGSVLAMLEYPPAEEELWDPQVSQRGLVRLSEEMTQVNEILQFPAYREPMAIRGSGGSVFAARTVSLPHPTQRAVAASSGETYATITSEYQVFSLRPDGRMAWALRVPWQRAPITESEIEAEVSAFRSRRNWEDFTRSDYDWPELRPAIEAIAVDGSGNLYVYPYPAAGEEEDEERMVDVYSAEGERIFCGWIPSVNWRYARGDHVYTLESDDQTGEERVVRYRLVEPF